VVDPLEHNSKNRRDDLDHPSDYQFLKDNYMPWNYLVSSPIYVRSLHTPLILKFMYVCLVSLVLYHTHQILSSFTVVNKLRICM
jgi:hypothetical protein